MYPHPPRTLAVALRQVKTLRRDYVTLVAGDIHTFCDKLSKSIIVKYPRNFTAANAAVDVVSERLLSLQKSVQGLKEDILNICGAGTHYNTCEEVEKEINRGLRFVDDISCACLAENHVELRRRGGLQFQQK